MPLLSCRRSPNGIIISSTSLLNSPTLRAFGHDIARLCLCGRARMRVIVKSPHDEAQVCERLRCCSCRARRIPCLARRPPCLQAETPACASWPPGGSHATDVRQCSVE